MHYELCIMNYEFKDKYMMNSLQPGASFMSEYIIRIEK